MRNLILILVLLSFISCSRKLIKTRVVDGIKIEKINIKYLNNISSVKLQPNDNLVFGVGKLEGDFWINNQTPESFTTTYIKKTGDKIDKIDRRKFISKTGAVIISNFYPNGKLKYRTVTMRTEPISNEYFEEIRFGFYLNETLSLDLNGNIKNHFDFDRDMNIKLEEFINILSKINDLKGKPIGIGTGYLGEFGVSGDVGLLQAKKIKENHPYWVVSYNYRYQAYDISIYDGKTGELIEEISLKFQSKSGIN